MEGFFYKEEINQKKTIKNNIYNCENCGLDKNCTTPNMPISGFGQKKILIVAEAPGAKEDQKGTQLIGTAGKTLRLILNEYNIDLDKDCWKTNAVNCRPPMNRTPKTKEINCCRHKLIKTINDLKPKKIILLGASALESFIGDRMQKIGGIKRWVGYSIPDQHYKCWVFPTYHPQYLNYNNKDKVLRQIFKKHIKNAIGWSKEFKVFKYKIKKICEAYGAIIYLESLLKKPMTIFIDFETTGIKPHRKGHKVLTMSITTYDNEATAFPIFYKNKKFMLMLKRVLTSQKIKKIGHNIKFEDTWCKWIFGYNITPWAADTMIKAHCVDNRTGITGLKFQSYVNFGVIGYDNKVESYKDAKSKNANDFNKLEEFPLNDLLEYNGMDTLLTKKLYHKLKLSKNNIEGNNLFTQGQIELSKVEYNGLHINIKYYEKQNRILLKKMDLLKKKILESEEVQKWTEENFNFNSDTQLSKLLYKILNYKITLQTPTGKGSVNAEALKKIDTPFIKMILEWKKLNKIQNTYIAGFLRETVNNYMRPNYNLNVARSYRSSSSHINFQNIPARDKQAQKITRGGILPRTGRQLLEIDYSKLEVCISACYNKDPILIAEVTDPTTDMHRDTARDILCKKEITKEERHLAKNNLVFPLFYGDYYIQCAANLWKNMSQETKINLPFKKYEQFENHIKKIEDNFWNVRFKVYNNWRNEVWNEYQKTGVVYSYTGFIYKGYMNRKETSNYQIQGSAFHCLLWSLIQLNKFLIENKFETVIIGQIHDSIVFDIVPDEIKELFPVIRKIMTIDIREYWKWIIVPLNIDAEITEINKPWSTKEEIEI